MFPLELIRDFFFQAAGEDEALFATGLKVNGLTLNEFKVLTLSPLTYAKIHAVFLCNKFSKPCFGFLSTHFLDTSSC